MHIASISATFRRNNEVETRFNLSPLCTDVRRTTGFMWFLIEYIENVWKTGAPSSTKRNLIFLYFLLLIALSAIKSIVSVL